MVVQRKIRKNESFGSTPLLHFYFAKVFSLSYAFKGCLFRNGLSYEVCRDKNLLDRCHKRILNRYWHVYWIYCRNCLFLFSSWVTMETLKENSQLDHFNRKALTDTYFLQCRSPLFYFSLFSMSSSKPLGCRLYFSKKRSY